MVENILSAPVEDGVTFRVKRIQSIMDEAEYPGVRVSMETTFDGVITPLKVDISTGDVITPKEVRYRFKLMLEDRSIEVWAYNLETVLAEKLESIIYRGVTNTRMRDFYDVHILSQLYKGQLSSGVFQEALLATCRRRRHLERLEEAVNIFDEVERDAEMENLWHSYQKHFSYAANLSWHTVIESARTLYAIAV